MTDRPLTLMAVHAHPDDEATGTGGVLARYAAEGIRTVLVTCTDGACGDGPGGVKPGATGHDPAAVALIRRQELEASCGVLKVSDLEMLDYADSGMMGWPSNDAPGSFWRTPVEEGAARLAELMRHYRPDVVVTYDENGFYGHPDHIQAHRIRGLLKLRAGPRSWSRSSRWWRAGSGGWICGGGCGTTSVACWRRWVGRMAGSWPSTQAIVTLPGCNICSTVHAGTPMPFETT